MITAIGNKHHRFTRKIIAADAWHDYRFPMSLRPVAQMLLECGTIVSCETIRRSATRLGPESVRCVHRKIARPDHIWHLGEGVISLARCAHWLRRPVGQNGQDIGEIIQTRGDTMAANRLLSWLLQQQSMAPKRLITDKPAFDRAANRRIMPNVEHHSSSRGLASMRLKLLTLEPATSLECFGF